MNIDKNLLASFAALDDASLMAAIKTVALSSGVKLPDEPIDKVRLDALRRAMMGATDEDIANAKKLFKGYKNNE